jgi:hypothetical protein
MNHVFFPTTIDDKTHFFATQNITRSWILYVVYWFVLYVFIPKHISKGSRTGHFSFLIEKKSGSRQPPDFSRVTGSLSRNDGEEVEPIVW